MVEAVIFFGKLGAIGVGAGVYNHLTSKIESDITRRVVFIVTGTVLAYFFFDSLLKLVDDGVRVFG